MGKPKVMLVGHSYVWRMEAFIRGSPDPRVKPDLNLPRDLDTPVRFCGTGGSTVPDVVSRDLASVETIRPDVVILQIGSNDLADKHRPLMRPETVGSQIHDLAWKLINHLNVSQVVVCEEFRCPKKYQLFPDFNANIDALNQYLSVVIDALPCASYWSHHGFKLSELDLYLHDGIHMNETGNFKLFKSFRGAAIQALRSLGN